MQHSDVSSTVLSGESKVTLLPQTFVTTVTMKNEEARIALDITKEWEKIQGEDSPLAMGCIVVNKEFGYGDFNKVIIQDATFEVK